jgi:Flp pilus assembly protein TadD
MTDGSCPADLLAHIASAAERDTEAGLAEAARALEEHPRDPRLHFLQGSLFAAQQRYPEAVDALQVAVALAPAYHIARFQLGFLRLTSGAVDAAIDSWLPLRDLQAEDPLRLFAEGLGELARDAFAAARSRLLQGIALNTDHPALNGDMRLLVEAMPREDATPPSGPQSSQADWLLRQMPGGPTRH